MFNNDSEREKEICLSKIAYKSKVEAEKMAEAFKATYGTKSHAYLCKICGCYHLATQKYND